MFTIVDRDFKGNEKNKHIIPDDNADMEELTTGCRLEEQTVYLVIFIRD